MNHKRANTLEMLLRNLVGEETGKTQLRGSIYKGVTMDADSFDDDANAIEGLWLAIELFQQKSELRKPLAASRKERARSRGAK